MKRLTEILLTDTMASIAMVFCLSMLFFFRPGVIILIMVLTLIALKTYSVDQELQAKSRFPVAMPYGGLVMVLAACSAALVLGIGFGHLLLVFAVLFLSVWLLAILLDQFRSYPRYGPHYGWISGRS